MEVLHAIRRSAAERRSSHPGPTPNAPRPRSAPAVGGAIARGLASLVEGQRQFAEEFGLPYGRVFADGFEGFKGRAAEAVIREWLTDREHGAERVEALFSDLVAHQMALVAALDGAVLHALEGSDAADSEDELPLWARIVRSITPGKQRETADPGLRYLCLVAPAFVTAYDRARKDINK